MPGFWNNSGHAPLSSQCSAPQPHQEPSLTGCMQVAATHWNTEEDDPISPLFVNPLHTAAARHGGMQKQALSPLLLPAIGQALVTIKPMGCCLAALA